MDRAARRRLNKAQTLLLAMGVEHREQIGQRTYGGELAKVVAWSTPLTDKEFAFLFPRIRTSAYRCGVVPCGTHLSLAEAFWGDGVIMCPRHQDEFLQREAARTPRVPLSAVLSAGADLQALPEGVEVIDDTAMSDTVIDRDDNTDTSVVAPGDDTAVEPTREDKSAAPD